ncbi:MAG: 5'-nucleotidase C-terminal domain-containing protein, partial [Oscillospiraceae bacterium]|nr:5'-nucleotidase C-terminal domain-containing protein [Oscillospiraceae bacterium]
MKQMTRKLLASILAVLMVVSMLPNTFAADGNKHITILATSDMHGNVWGYSYEDNKETTNNGMARLYTYIQQVRKENPNTILVDGGDDIQGTIMTDDLANKNPDNEHPIIAAMNYMKYDSMTLGNHEFNWGIKNMLKITGQAEFPVLGANILNADGSLVTGKAYTIVERGGVKIAIIGVCTPDIPMWDGTKQGIQETTYEDPAVSVKRAIDEIGDQADVIMVSAHMGFNAEHTEEDSGKRLAEKNPQIDVLQVAHAHTTVNEKVGNTVVGGVKNLGAQIARFDLTLDKNNKITESKVEIVDMNGVEPSAELRAVPVVAKMHQETIDFIFSKVLGTTTAKFQPENEIRGVAEGRLQDTAVMDLIMKVQLEVSGADVTACALFKDGSDLPKGDIYYSNIFDIYKYDNTLMTVNVTGKELKAYMEWAASCYAQWKPGDINIALDKDHPDYLLDMFYGVNYEVNLSKPAGERIENVIYKGAPLKDDEIIKLAVNNYRYSSALKSKGLVAGTMDWESANSIRDMLVEYFAKNSPVAPKVDHNWKITGVDLGKNDPRRAEIIRYINEGYLDVPKNFAYNLADYDKLVAQAKAAGAPDQTTYVVVAGDNLWNLAYKYYGHGAWFGIIADANGIKSPYTIYVGQTLVIPKA